MTDKLTKLRDALEAKPQLLATLLDNFREDVPRIVGPWRQQPNDTFPPYVWVRRDLRDRIVVVLVEDQGDEDGWHVQRGTDWWHLPTDELPPAEKLEDAEDIADQFLLSRGFTFVAREPRGHLLPWFGTTNNGWTRTSTKGKVVVFLAHSHARGWKSLYNGIEHPNLDTCKKLVDGLLRSQGWAMADNDTDDGQKTVGPWTQDTTVPEGRPVGWARRVPGAPHVVAYVHQLTGGGKWKWKWTGGLLISHYNTRAEAQRVTDRFLKQRGHDLIDDTSKLGGWIRDHTSLVRKWQREDDDNNIVAEVYKDANGDWTGNRINLRKTRQDAQKATDSLLVRQGWTLP